MRHKATTKRRCRYIAALCKYGKKHWAKPPDVATSLNNLAGLYRTQGDYEAALPLYRRSLQIWEETLGKNHPMWRHR